MSHRDPCAGKLRLNFELLKIALLWLLRGADWKPVHWRSDCTWKSPRLLAVTALMWSWSDEALVGDRLTTARKVALRMFPQTQTVASTYQGFIKLLRHWTDTFVAVLQESLRRRMEQELSDCMRVGKYLLFAVDGSRIDLPRTLSHQRVFSATRPGKKGKRKRRRHAKQTDAKKATTSSMWITTLWHAGTGLPWNWRLGPGDSSERAHWLEMLSSLVNTALVTADAGFVGYEYSHAVISAGHHLLLRVGSNVRLLKKLGYVKERDGTVYLWPDKLAKRDNPPLVFRLVISHNGKHPVYLLTDILSSQQFSDTHIIEAYKRRWGVELFYRHLKQTFGKRKLKSTSAESAYVEMHWSLLGLWSMALYALYELRQLGISPSRLSFAKLLRAFRRILRDYLHPVQQGHKLRDLLRTAVIDEYERSSDKASRDYPRKKHEHPPKPPNIINATKAQCQRAQRIKNAA